MTVEFIQEKLISQGYRFFLLGNIQSAEKGEVVFHYDLFEHFPAGVNNDDIILLSTTKAEEVIQDFIQGNSKIMLHRRNWGVNSNGSLYLYNIIQELKY
jgi:hypothetical protein